MVIDLDSLQKLSILQLKSKYFLVKLLNPVKKRLFLMVERGGGHKNMNLNSQNK